MLLDLPSVAQPVPEIASDELTVGAYLGGTAITALVLLVALYLRHRRPAREGTESTAYEVARATIEDQRTQLVALRVEGEALRTARDACSAGLAIAEANVLIAQEAARTAATAAEANAAELRKARVALERCESYIHTLRTALARHGLDIPDPP